jgi:CLIP-associating protein 1/2
VKCTAVYLNLKIHLFYRHAAVLVETIKKGIHDADAEARVEARK